MEIVQNIKLQIAVNEKYQEESEKNEKLLEKLNEEIWLEFDKVKNPCLKVNLFVLKDVFYIIAYAKVDWLKIIFEVPLNKEEKIRPQLDEFVMQFSKALKEHMSKRAVSTQEARILIKGWSPNVALKEKTKWETIVNTNNDGKFYTIYQDKDLSLVKEYLDVDVFNKILMTKFKNAILQSISALLESKIKSPQLQEDDND